MEPESPPPNIYLILHRSRELVARLDQDVLPRMRAVIKRSERMCVLTPVSGWTDPADDVDRLR